MLESHTQTETTTNTFVWWLQAAGVTMGKAGVIPVDNFSRTNVPGIWAIGDVTDRIALTPVALMEGGCFAKTCFGGEFQLSIYEVYEILLPAM